MVVAIHKSLQIKGDYNERKRTKRILNGRWLERMEPNLIHFMWVRRANRHFEKVIAIFYLFTSTQVQSLIIFTTNNRVAKVDLG